MRTVEEQVGVAVSTERKPGAAAHALDLHAHVVAVRRFWRSLLAITLLGVLVAGAFAFTRQPTYETTLTFFVATPTRGTNNTPLQADEFAQSRVNSFVGVVTSERMAQLIVDDAGLSIPADQVAKSISASAEPNTVLMDVTVTDVSSSRALSIGRSIAKNLDQLIGQLDNRSADGSVQLHVLSGPTLNPAPVSPRKKLDLALGLLIGLGIGLAQALLRHQFDTSIRTRDQLSEISGLPTLGSLEYAGSARSAPILAPNTRSRRAEGFRQLRTNLRFLDAASPVEVLVVTSSVEGEGKTTTSANLAQSFAGAGRRVLLIDGDLRKPKLERYLDLEGSVGLTDILIGDVNFDEVVQEWGPNGLVVLASGRIPPNPSELLGSASMEKLLQQARIDFDLVVIDTPPLLPITDAAVTSTWADGSILVVRHGRTRLDQVRRSLEALKTVDARVLGTVLTMVPHSSTDRQQSYYADYSENGRRN